MSGELWWFGNAAKTKVIGEILGRTRGAKALVFDYGCGAGGDWPAILSAHPNLEFVGYDPSGTEIARARERLRGRPARLLTGSELAGERFEADYVVSFSVLEHVWNRRGYLETAKQHLAKDGFFYLNYDDGHFRIALDVDERQAWVRQLRQWVRNVIARPLAQIGVRRGYQERVPRAALDNLVSEVGFRVERAFYSNLSQLKWLSKTITDARHEEFARLWVGLEDALNTYLSPGPRLRGDGSNLWHVMGSRTLVLRHP